MRAARDRLPLPPVLLTVGGIHPELVAGDARIARITPRQQDRPVTGGSDKPVRRTGRRGGRRRVRRSIFRRIILRGRRLRLGARLARLARSGGVAGAYLHAIEHPVGQVEPVVGRLMRAARDRLPLPPVRLTVGVHPELVAGDARVARIAPRQRNRSVTGRGRKPVRRARGRCGGRRLRLGARLARLARSGGVAGAHLYPVEHPVGERRQRMVGRLVRAARDRLPLPPVRLAVGVHPELVAGDVPVARIVPRQRNRSVAGGGDKAARRAGRARRRRLRRRPMQREHARNQGQNDPADRRRRPHCRTVLQREPHMERIDTRSEPLVKLIRTGGEARSRCGRSPTRRASGRAAGGSPARWSATDASNPDGRRRR